MGIFLHAEMLLAWPEHQVGWRGWVSLGAQCWRAAACHQASLPLPLALQAQLAAFLQWALSHEGTWAVTISELLRWMKDPVPASHYQPQCSAAANATVWQLGSWADQSRARQGAAAMAR